MAQSDYDDNSTFITLPKVNKSKFTAKINKHKQNNSNLLVHGKSPILKSNAHNSTINQKSQRYVSLIKHFFFN